MRRHSYPYPTNAFATKTTGHAFPWSKITLLFLMTSSFLIFATTGTSNTETLASWTTQVSEILTGTALFTLAAILLIWAGRLMPKNI
ncbi:hypothetical protein MNBD_ALPHA02-2569 [hydrothermal vent metagenome]|uniref:Uncharacterized protein n=1 Tax=hydrothermal vent metagenome TaxID=652676 RepID=A0A3B0RT66_9ZZZZ